MPYTLYVTFNNAQYCENQQFCVQLGDIIRFNPGPSLLHQGIVLYTNYPPQKKSYDREKFWKLKWKNQDGTVAALNENGTTRVDSLDIMYELVAGKIGNFKFMFCFKKNGTEKGSVYVRVQEKTIPEPVSEKRPALEPTTEPPPEVKRVRHERFEIDESFICRCSKCRSNPVATIDLTNLAAPSTSVTAETWNHFHVQPGYVDCIYKIAPGSFISFNRIDDNVNRSESQQNVEHIIHEEGTTGGQAREPILQPIPLAEPQAQQSSCHCHVCVPVHPPQQFINRRGERVIGGTVMNNVPAQRVLGAPIVFDPPDVVEPPRETASSSSLITKFLQENDNPNRTIKIRLQWNYVEELQLHANQAPFYGLLQKLAEREKCSPSLIVLMLDDRVIQPEDTPASIKYHVTKLITGRIVYDLETMSTKKFRNPNIIKVKIQGEKLKNPVQIKIDKTQPFSSILTQCAEILSTTFNRIKLMFDGEVIDLDSTPITLELMGGEVLDCIVMK